MQHDFIPGPTSGAASAYCAALDLDSGRCGRFRNDPIHGLGEVAEVPDLPGAHGAAVSRPVRDDGPRGPQGDPAGDAASAAQATVTRIGGPGVEQRQLEWRLVLVSPSGEHHVTPAVPAAQLRDVPQVTAAYGGWHASVHTRWRRTTVSDWVAEIPIEP